MNNLLELIEEVETREEAETIVRDCIYAHCAIVFEALEHKGLIYGNGHHIAQEIAEVAREKVSTRWRSPK